jgi:Contractile injection system tube protein
MERVAFLLEKTGERIPCLLNPDSVVIRRLAGVRTRRSNTGPLTGAGLKDDPLIYTGGGTTEINLDLLFDVSIAGSSIATEDVRDLTSPLWALAEGSAQENGLTQPPLVRFVWGKAWNIPGVVTAVAERLESFSSEGIPGRSWLRMRLLRVSEPTLPGPEAPTLGPAIPEVPEVTEIPPDQLVVHEVTGGVAGGSEEREQEAEPDEAGPPARLDTIAQQYCGYPWWKPSAQLNNIADPLNIAPGTLLSIPQDWLAKGSS